MFGLQIITKKKLNEIERNAQNKAIAELVNLLRKKDKIYLEPVTMNGDNQTISDCIFFAVSGNALTIYPSADSTNHGIVNTNGSLEFI
jgi:hypothetical protein